MHDSVWGGGGGIEYHVKLVGRLEEGCDNGSSFPDSFIYMYLLELPRSYWQVLLAGLVAT